MDPAHLIASNLAALPHPDGGVRGLPGFQSRLLPEPMQEQVGRTALEIGQGIVHLLTSHGMRIVGADDTPTPTDDIEPKVALLTCRACGTVLLEMSLVESRVLTDGPGLLRSLAGRSQECPHARI